MVDGMKSVVVSYFLRAFAPETKVWWANCSPALSIIQHWGAQWMYSYNHTRPIMTLGGFTPKQHLAMAA